ASAASRWGVPSKNQNATILVRHPPPVRPASWTHHLPHQGGGSQVGGGLKREGLLIALLPRSSSTNSPASSIVRWRRSAARRWRRRFAHGNCNSSQSPVTTTLLTGYVPIGAMNRRAGIFSGGRFSGGRRSNLKSAGPTIAAGGSSIVITI